MLTNVVTTVLLELYPKLIAATFGYWKNLIARFQLLRFLGYIKTAIGAEKFEIKNFIYTELGDLLSFCILFSLITLALQALSPQRLSLTSS